VRWSCGPGHSQEGLRSGKELISDQGLKSTVTLDSGKHETPNPDIESGKSHGKVQKAVRD
jgi:hypothetical protein